MSGIRISTGQIYDRGSKGISRGQANMYKIQTQLGTRTKIAKPSDDPVASARSMVLQQSKSYTEQSIRNLDDIDGKLSECDIQLGYLNDRLVAVRDLVIQAGNTEITAVDRVAIATEIEEIYKEIIGLANAQDSNGNYLFSGYQGDVRPYSQTQTGVAYFGDNGKQLIQTSSGRQLAANITGPEAFNFKDGNGFFSTDAGNENYPPVSVVSRNDGDAVLTPGFVNTANQRKAIAENGSKYTITTTDGINFKMTSKDNPAKSYDGTFADGKILFNVAAGGQRLVSFNVKGNLTANDVFDVDLSATQNSGLGIINQGSVKNPATYTAAINSGKYEKIAIKFVQEPNPNNPAEIITKYRVFDVTNVNFDEATGAYKKSPVELTPVDNTFVAGQEIVLNGLTRKDNNEVVDLGISVAIDGLPNGGDSFSISASKTTDVFQTLNGIVNLLHGSDPKGNSLAGEGGFSDIEFSNRLAGFLKDLDQALQNNDKNRANIGATLQEVDYLRETSSDKILQYTGSISKLIDLDYAEAISRMMLQQTSLQAAISAFQQTTQLSLFK